MTTTGATVRRLLHGAGPNGTATATDRELLRRFAADGDQAAFGEVVRRHTGMVHGVCRRGLPTAQDAEDACQAVFLVLAKKAKGGRWGESVAHWLFATARNVARTSRRMAERRAKRERRAAVPEAVAPIDRLTGRELLAILDEELDRQPPRYRDPLVLYYLEELTRDEIAARLGVPAGTVKIRLERGRKKLGDALARRGVALGTGLLALAATSPAGASPPRLMEAIRAAVGGDVPPAVAALAEGAAVNGVIKKVGVGLILAAAVAALGFGLGEPRSTSAGPPDKAMPARPAPKAAKEAPADKPAKDETKTITGKVVGPDGKPVAGAEIVHVVRGGKPAVLGKSAADGSFSVAAAVKDFSDLFPRAAGLAPDRFLNLHAKSPAEVTLKMVKDTPIRGRVLDTQGQAVAGASVAVRTIYGFENDSLDRYLAAFQKRQADGVPPPSQWWTSLAFEDRSVAVGDPVYAAATDKDGRFTIPGVGSERVASLRLQGPGIATTEVVVLTREGFDPTPYNRETLEKLKSPYAELGYHPMLYPPDTAVVAEAEKPIRGVVKDAATGRPRAGVKVTLRDQKNYRMPELSATTDADGRYAIRGVKKAGEYSVNVKRDPETGHIGRTVKAKDTPAYEPVILDVGVAKGIVLTGRLLDDRTGEPVSGFVCVGVLYDNEAARAQPAFDSPDTYDFANAREDGVYRTVVPPGPILLMAGVTPTGGKGPTESRFQQMKIDAAYPHYFDKDMSGFRSGSNTVTMMQGQWSKVLNFKPDQAEATFDVRFKRASRFEVRVRDPDGKPLAGATVAGNTARDWALPEECKTDTCVVHELETAKPRFLAFYHPARKLVGTLTLKGDEKEPAVVTLVEPGRVKGRLVDGAGQPIANAVVSLGYERRAADEIDRGVHGDWRSSPPKVETNANGEFAVDMVIPGEPFSVYGRKKDRFVEPAAKGALVTVKPGEAKDLGAVTVKEQ